MTSGIGACRNAVKNPYAKKIKQTVTIRLSTDVIEYFKQIAQEVQLSYQTLINSYLAECVREKRRPVLPGGDCSDLFIPVQQRKRNSSHGVFIGRQITVAVLVVEYIDPDAAVSRLGECACRG